MSDTKLIPFHDLSHYGTRSDSLGSGGYAKVYRYRNDSESYAVKIYKNSHHPSMYKEIIHLRMLRNCKHILPLLDVCPYNDSLALVFPVMDSDLNYPKTKFHNRTVALQIALSLAEVHSHNLIHGDFKQGNILLKGQEVFLADFGASVYAGFSNLPKEDRGCTLWFSSPEVLLLDRVTQASDIWSLGCVLHLLLFNDYVLSGEEEDTGEKHARRIFRAFGRPSLEEWPDAGKSTYYDRSSDIPETGTEDFSSVEDEKLRDLLRKIFVINPEKRPTITEVLAHPFFGHVAKPRDEAQLFKEAPPYPEKFFPGHKEIWESLVKEYGTTWTAMRIMDLLDRYYPTKASKVQFATATLLAEFLKTGDLTESVIEDFPVTIEEVWKELWELLKRVDLRMEYVTVHSIFFRLTPGTNESSLCKMFDEAYAEGKHAGLTPLDFVLACMWGYDQSNDTDLCSQTCHLEETTKSTIQELAAKLGFVSDGPSKSETKKRARTENTP